MHTDGTWRVDSEDDLRIERWRDMGIEPIHIATVHDGEDVEDPEANAHLIAAAPDLVEALDNLTASMETVMLYYGHHMPDGDRAHRNMLTREARKLVDSLIRQSH